MRSLIILAILLLVPVKWCQADVTELPHLKGIYALLKVHEPPTNEILSRDSVRGISVRVGWRHLEPSQGCFDWQFLDSCFAEAEKHNKKVMLRVLPGILSPDWLYDDPSIRWMSIDDTAKAKRAGSDRAPLPWNDRYLALWLSALETIANRYRSRPSLVMVHMTGPTVLSGEMHLPKNADSVRNLEIAGYQPDKLIDAWRHVIDRYCELFPTTLLSLNIAKPLKNDGVLEAVVDYAARTCSTRYCLQGNWLSGRTPDDFKPLELIRSFRNRAVIGFQMLGVSKNVRRMGSLDDALRKGLTVGATYFEIYPPDLPQAEKYPLLPSEWLVP